ncbi:TPA: hypothetical protein ROI66_000456 [Citrobacter sedlakii]|nr:hypothetical protein [Citrobacter sedlakii]
MSTVTKERLEWLANISGRDEIDEIDGEEIRELARIALASLEAEPVACPKCNDTGMADSGGVQPWGEPISVPCDCTAQPALAVDAEPVAWTSEEALVEVYCGETGMIGPQYMVGNIPLYLHAQHAPVVPDEMPLHTGPREFGRPQAYVDGWNACRDAMLQGSQPVTTPKKLTFEQWLSQQTGTIDVECGCVMNEVFFHWLRVAYEAGNSPVICEGRRDEAI